MFPHRVLHRGTHHLPVEPTWCDQSLVNDLGFEGEGWWPAGNVEDNRGNPLMVGRLYCRAVEWTWDWSW